jgi:hypothetical protein
MPDCMTISNSAAAIPNAISIFPHDIERTCGEFLQAAGSTSDNGLMGTVSLPCSVVSRKPDGNSRYYRRARQLEFL